MQFFVNFLLNNFSKTSRFLGFSFVSLYFFFFFFYTKFLLYLFLIISFMNNTIFTKKMYVRSIGRFIKMSHFFSKVHVVCRHLVSEYKTKSTVEKMVCVKDSKPLH